jgi:predicted metalloprotease
VARGVGIGGGGALLLLLAVMLLGGDPSTLLNVIGQTQGSAVTDAAGPPANDEGSEFVRVVLGYTEDTWAEIFAQGGATYRPPQLVLYSGMTRSACGMGSAASGPFYCPPDYQIYLDLTFFNELARLGGPGDFAAAYVIGHEVAHHVQNLLGTSGQVHQARQRSSRAEANRLSVLLELQADCYAGVWAHYTNRRHQVLEPGDVEEGLAAAAAIGDDRLQRMSGRGVHPESFTHGSSAQRVQWLRRGLETGNVDACNTFG